MFQRAAGQKRDFSRARSAALRRSENHAAAAPPPHNPFSAPSSDSERGTRFEAGEGEPGPSSAPRGAEEKGGASLPPALSAARKRRMLCRETAKPLLPPALRLTGNANPWADALTHLAKTPHVPLLIHGPTGSGKTKGVHACAGLLCRSVYEVDPSATGSSSTMREWLSEVCSAKTLLGERLFFIDDLEGFDERILSVIAKEATSTRPTHAAPLVLVCTDPWVLGLQRFRSVQRVGLRSPQQADCIQWARAIGLAARHTDGALQRFAREAKGDLRQFCMQLRMPQLALGCVDQQHGIFEGTRRLMWGEIGVEQWVRMGEGASFRRLLHHNYPTLLSGAPSALEAVAEIADGLSCTMALQSEPAEHIRGMLVCAHLARPRANYPVLRLQRCEHS